MGKSSSSKRTEELTVENESSIGTQKQSSSVGYRGVVAVKVKRGNKVIRSVSNHNEGTSVLFGSIASYLCGSTGSNSTGVTIPAAIPRYIDAGTTNTATFVVEDLILYTPSVTGKRVSDYKVTNASGQVTTVSNAALFTAYIPYETILNPDKGIDTLMLLSEQRNAADREVDANTLLARVLLEEPVTLPDASYSLVVEWAMSVENQLS